MKPEFPFVIMIGTFTSATILFQINMTKGNSGFMKRWKVNSEMKNSF